MVGHSIPRTEVVPVQSGGCHLIPSRHFIRYKELSGLYMTSRDLILQLDNVTGHITGYNNEIIIASKYATLAWNWTGYTSCFILASYSRSGLRSCAGEWGRKYRVRCWCREQKQTSRGNRHGQPASRLSQKVGWVLPSPTLRLLSNSLIHPAACLRSSRVICWSRANILARLLVNSPRMLYNDVSSSRSSQRCIEGRCSLKMSPRLKLLPQGSQSFWDVYFRRRGLHQAGCGWPEGWSSP